MKLRSLAPTPSALVLLAFAAGTVHADATLDKIRQRDKLVVGVILSVPPFGTIDPVTQEHIGYNVELSEGVAKGVGGSADAAIELETSG